MFGAIFVLKKKGEYMTTYVNTKQGKKKAPLSEQREREMYSLYMKFCSQGLNYEEAYNKAEATVLAQQ